MAVANLSISPDVIREAKEVGIRDEQWNEQNASFLAEYSKLIEKDGLALEENRTF